MLGQSFAFLYSTVGSAAASDMSDRIVKLLLQTRSKLILEVDLEQLFVFKKVRLNRSSKIDPFGSSLLHYDELWGT